MTDNFTFITYQEMLKRLETTKPNNHLLLGNGFNASLGVKTSYKSIFQQMKKNNEDYKSIIVDEDKFDLESFIGECKAKINKENNDYYDFMVKYFHNKIKLDFMKAITELTTKEVKKVYQENNDKIYLLLKQFDNFFTLNYDPFLYQLLMAFKNNTDANKTAIAFPSRLEFFDEVLNDDEEKMYKTIKEAYNNGELNFSIPNFPKETIRMDRLTKSNFTSAVKTYLDGKYSESNIKKIVNKIWEERNTDKQKYIDKLDDGFSLFGNNFVYNRPETQNLFFLHGAFHIVERGKSVYKITQQNDKALYQRISEIADDAAENIVCIFSDKDKKDEIDKSKYLTNCFNKLKELKGSILILGSSLADNDEHIFKQIQESNISTIYITTFEDQIKKVLPQTNKFFPNKEVIFVDINTISYNK